MSQRKICGAEKEGWEMGGISVISKIKENNVRKKEKENWEICEAEKEEGWEMGEEMDLWQ